RCRLGYRAEREARVRPDEELHLVRAGGTRLALAQLDAELALAEPDGDQLARHRFGERPTCSLPRRTQLRMDARHLGLGLLERLARRVDRIAPFVERRQLRPRTCGPFEQFAGALGAVPAPQVGEA